jgi:hypothetical protein
MRLEKRNERKLNDLLSAVLKSLFEQMKKMPTRRQNRFGRAFLL